MNLTTEVRQAVRALRRSPALVLTATATLSVALGTVLATLSVAHQTLLRPLPLERPDNLLSVYQKTPGSDHSGTTGADFLDLERVTAGDAELAYYFHRHLDDEVTVETAEGRELARGVRVSPNFFAVLGARFHMGNVPPSDQEPAVVLSNAVWRQRFSAAPDVIGRVLNIDEKAHVVSAILPPDFAFPLVGGEVDYWVSKRLEGPIRQDRDASVLEIVARPRPKETRAAARQAILAAGERLLIAGGPRPPGQRWFAEPLVERSLGWLRAPLGLVLTGAAALLAAACLNLGFVLAARMHGREHEIAVRVAIGASRVQVARQVILESGLLVAAGTLLGLATAHQIVGLFIVFNPDPLPRLERFETSGAVLFLAACLSSVCTGVLSGPPIWRLLRSPVASGLRRDYGRGNGGSGGRAFMGGQAAAAALLLVGAITAALSLIRLNGVDPGFSREGALAIRASLPARLPGSEVSRFFREARKTLSALPGVASAGEISNLPLTPGSWGGQLYEEGAGLLPPASESVIDWEVAGPDFFKATGISILRGRTFKETDTMESPLVAVINQSLAQRFFAGRDPIGRTIGESPTGPWRRIIGVVKDVQQRSLDRKPAPQMWVASGQMFPWPSRHLVVRGTSDRLPAGTEVMAALRSLEPRVALGPVRELDELVQSSLSRARFIAALGGVLGAVAAFLAALGIAGVVGHFVGSRTREFGVRYALGATPGSVIRLVLSWTLVPVATGGAVGILSAVIADRLLGVGLPSAGAEPMVVGSAGAMVLMIASFAAMSPARRASRLDPAMVLRAQ